MLAKLNSFIEQKRIRVHLMRTEQWLRHKDVSHLPLPLQIGRKKHIRNLSEYWQRGVFPKNTQFPGKRLPHIRDELGTLCAMAYLVDKSGNSELVNQLATTNNLVYINDVKEGPLLDWIEKSGLTKAEAARVQPAYDWRPDPVHTLFNFSWVIFLLFFFVLEFLNFKLVRWLGISERKKMVAHAYLALGTFCVSGALTLVTLLLFAVLGS